MSTVLTPDPVVSAATAAPARARLLPPLRHWKPSVVLATTWLVGLALLAVFADRLPFVRKYDFVPKRPAGSAAGTPDPAAKLRKYGTGPGWHYLFGSDKIGRDVFARCVYAAQKTLTIGVCSIIAGVVIGGLLGMFAGYYRGFLDRVLSTVFDVLLAFPAIVLALVIVGRFFNSGKVHLVFFHVDKRFFGVIVVLTLLSIAPLARIVRAQTLSLSQREYVLAARGVGAGDWRILIKEILPNLVPAMVSVTFTGLAILLVAEGGLAFLGYSVQIPSPTWGLMIQEARPDMDKGGWWAVFFPCMFLFITVLSFNVLGDRIARRFDIREATV